MNLSDRREAIRRIIHRASSIHKELSELLPITDNFEQYEQLLQNIEILLLQYRASCEEHL